MAITAWLRQEHDEIRSTIISPGVTATELGDYSFEQSEGVDINEVIVRPTAANM